MLDFFEQLSSEFMPHGGCYLWQPGLIWTHVIADALTGLAYLSIPLALVYFVRKRDDLAFSWIFVMFAAFILFCGVAHLFQILTIWEPVYWTEGAVKVATALVSVWTAVALWPLLPRALELPSPKQLRDEIKHRKQAEQELRELNRELEEKVGRRTEELEQFVYAASHDLLEPARVMKTYADFLDEHIEEDRSEEVDEDIHFIKRSAERMRELIDSLMKLSRTSREELNLETVSMDACVDEAIEHLDRVIEQKNVRIERDELPELTADGTLIADLFQNLLGNALKYGVNGSDTIEVTAERQGDRWVLGVRDHGEGIRAEHQEEIFQPFKHLHSWEDYDGTGIGLSICRRIVQRHGGEIWVESRPGEGAHFKFTIAPEEN